MTVYVDDSAIPATVGAHSSRWCHLFADTRAELHDFADVLGLRRDWFQDAPTTWHYDVTEGKRMRAIQLGARAVTWREGAEIIRERLARLDEAARRPLREQITARLESAGIGPDDPGLRQWATHNAGLGMHPEQAEENRVREADKEAGH